MYKHKKITLVLPCRNEGKHLAKVLSTVPSFIDQVLLVSNNSTDNTVRKAKSLNVQVIEDNRTVSGIGYGYAHITGIENAEGDIIIGSDCDGTYPLDDIARLIDEFIDSDIDFASCSRYPLKDKAAVPLLLRMGVKLLGVECRLLYGLKIKDILSGMWILNKHAAAQLNLTCGDWNLSPQIKINAASNPGISFKELSIYQNRRLGVTHQRYLKTGTSHILWILYNALTTKLLTGWLQFLRYGTVAVVSMVIDVGLLYALTSGLHVFYVISASISYLISMFLNYLMCKLWVFRSYRLNRHLSFVGFCLVGVIGLGLNDLLIWFFTSNLGVYYVYSKALAAGFVFFWSFGARRYLYQTSASSMKLIRRYFFLEQEA